MRTSSRLVTLATSIFLATACGDDADGSAMAGRGGGAGGASGGRAAAGGTAGGQQGASGMGEAGTTAASAGSDVAPNPGTPTPSGGTLKDGRCDPGNSGGTRESLGDKVKVLSMASAIYSGPVAHETGVYFAIDDDGLYRIPPGKDMPELIVATPEKRYAPWIDGLYLYYAISGFTGGTPMSDVERLPLSDLKAEPEPIISNPPRDWTADATHVYLHDPTTKELYRQPIAGGDKQVLLSDVSVEALRIRDGYLYYVPFTGGDDVIERMPVAGGRRETVVNAGGFDIGSYLLADTGVYWWDFYGTYFTANATPTMKTYVAGKETSVIEVRQGRVYWILDAFPSGLVGWTAVDGKDCAWVLSGGNEFYSADVGADGLFVTTFSIDNMLYRVTL